MHKVGHNIVQEPLIVGNDDGGVVGRAQFVDSCSHNAQCINIEARVGFIKNSQCGVEHGHLENLVFLLFASGKALVDRTVGKSSSHFNHFLFLVHEFKKIGS